MLQLSAAIPMGIIAAQKGLTIDSCLAPVLLVCNTLLIIVLGILRYYRIKDLYAAVPVTALLLSMAFAYAAWSAVDILAIPFNLPNLTEDAFKYMANTSLGFISVCLIGPIAEEIMMRRIILTEISQATGRKWLGIVISAAIFSVIHGNPIQMFFAMPAGVLLGWIYCKTGSLLTPICIHIMNNTVSFMMIKYEFEEPSDFTSPWTLTQLALYLIAAAALFILIERFYKKKDSVTEQ